MHPADVMIKVMASQIKDGEVFLHGLASPMPALAMFLAKLTHAPNMVYLAVAEGIDPDPEKFKLYPSSADPRHAAGCIGIGELAEAFDLAAKGKVDGMFLGGAQIDKHANINLTCIGSYDKPKVKLPGGAAAAYLSPIVKKLILWTTNHSKRTFVEKLDFKTGIGYEKGKDKKVVVVSNMAVFEAEERGLRLISVHPGFSIDDVLSEMSFEPIIDGYATTQPPSDEEMKIIQKLDPENVRYLEFKK